MLPEDFTQRFREICPSRQLDISLNSFKSPKNVGFRVNTLLAQENEAIENLNALKVNLTPVDWAQSEGVLAYLCQSDEREALTHSNLASDGRIYIQSLSSMLAAILLKPTKTDWVLDLAAAPGGKTILLADLMGNQGKISAVEPVKGRYFRLIANLKRTGVTNTSTYMKDGRAVGSLKPDTFDKVLLDAPCSSESRFRENDESTTNHWNLRKVSECAKKQKRLILSGFDALKPGGTMVYCTCSYSPEENERVLSHLLKKRQNAELLPVNMALENISSGLTNWAGKPLNDSCSNAVRVWPTADMDGFFLALIAKH